MAEDKYAADEAYDKKHGIKEDSPEDRKMDKKRGISESKERGWKGGRKL